MVKTLDIDLTFANNGEEAVALFQSLQPDMIFMDISMPILDGKEATRAIRKIEADQGGHVPIVALTAHALTGDETAFLSVGLDGYLTKPLRKNLIFDTISQHCPEDVKPPIPDTT
jgi:CheY-like chemotaxis protein